MRDERSREEAFLAHSANASGRPQLLADHLRAVSSLAGSFARAFDASAEAELAGLLHDIGKYGERFQRRLQGLERGIDHWSPGAWIAVLQRAFSVAMAVHGHHVGLQTLSNDSLRDLRPGKLAASHPLGLSLAADDPDLLIKRLETEGLSVPTDVPSAYGRRLRETASALIDVRMLYSALVDADFLDTEAHFAAGADNDLSSPEPPPLQPRQALDTLLNRVAELEKESTAATVVNRVRSDLLQACLEGGRAEQRLWTLSAPTGSGKTLAMLAFALQHAAEHDLRRIVIVIPYLSIIEQTATIYKGIFAPVFGEDYVREHHSLAGTRDGRDVTGADADGDEDEDRQRLHALADRWDAPIIVTTSVQLLESLFANRPAACRKLHRLARSVILFDEVQTIPSSLAVPTLATLSWLAERYRVSVVFSTATQPAFTHLDDAVRRIGDSGWQPREVVPSDLQLFSRARRTSVQWPDLDTPYSWADLAKAMTDVDQALCIVNVKAHARDLMGELTALGVDDALHLSTAMCPAHRQATLAEIRERLADGRPCHLVSTQCVEAGVDVDFPAVYRALGPLEAIAQAAGRCNRNGRQARGEVRVFLPEDDALPSGAYEQATQVTRMLLLELGTEAMDIDDPELFGRYYRRLYDLTRPQARKPELTEAICRQDFPAVAHLYRVIATDTVNVLAPWRGAITAYNNLVRRARDRGLNGKWTRDAQPYSVSVYRPCGKDPIWTCLEQILVAGTAHSEDWFIYTNADDYDPKMGLLPRKGPALWLVS